MIRPSPLLPLPDVELEDANRPDPVAMMRAAETAREVVVRKYDEAINYCCPGRVGIRAQADSLPVYDDTAGLAHAEFSSAMQQGLIPNFAAWVTFIGGLAVPADQRMAVNAKLQLVGRLVSDEINRSNFPLEMGEALQDIAIGTAGIDISEGIGLGSNLNARAIPLGNLLFLIGPDGMPDPIWEIRRGYSHQAQVLFPGSKPIKDVPTDKRGKELTFVECYARDWSEPAANRYFRTVFVTDCDNQRIIEEEVSGEGANPKIVFRWAKASGETWGRGPAVNCLPSIRKVNFAEQALLDATEMELMGLWQAEDDGVLNTNTVRMEPGSMVTIAAGSKGLSNVAKGMSIDIAGFVLEEARKTIKRAFFNDELGDPNRSPKTATEIDARVRKLAQAIGTPMGRILVEGIIPAVVRIVRILKDRGLLKLPVIDGKQISLLPTSPLAQAQRFEEIDRLVNFSGVVSDRLGREGVALLIAEDRWGEQLADRMQVPAEVLRTAEERATMVQRTAEVAGMTQQQPGGAEPSGPIDEPELPAPL